MVTTSDRWRAATGVIVGAGPAGRALAHSLGRLGVDVLCLDPRARAPWRTTWGMWDDEVRRLGLDGVVAATAHAPLVRFSPTEEIAIERPYHVLDPERLRAHLSDGIDVRADSVVTLLPDAVVLENGQRVEARFVIDARGASTTGCAQTAVGSVVRARGVPPVLMDFSLDHEDEDPRPTFGYVVPLDDDHALVEETALLAAPPMTQAVLARRLDTRLHAMGLHRAVVGDAPREWVRIPLDIQAPARAEALMRIGVAGGAVHPATGYALAPMLEDAPIAARAIGDALVRGAGAADIAQAAHRAIWPKRRRAARALLEYGREVLLPLDLALLRQFFRAFFALAPRHQRAYFSSSSDPIAVAGAMAAMWGGLPWALRARVLGADLRAVTRSADRAPELREGSPSATPNPEIRWCHPKDSSSTDALR